MAMLVICSVRDSAVDCFGVPIFVRHVGEAIRSFVDECNNEQSQFCKHSEDYELFQIGRYDDQTAAVLAEATPVSLMTGKAAKRAKE